MSTELPSPSGCALCGEIKSTHGWRTDFNGHTWQEPTQQQRKGRMRARREARTRRANDETTTKEIS